MNSVDAAWGRIEAWLERHAPASHRALGEAPAAGQLAETERSLGFTLPADLTALLLCHNGTERYEVPGDDEGEVNPAAFLPDGELYSLDLIPYVHTLYTDVNIGIDPSDRLWVPWAGVDDGHSGLLVDCGSGAIGSFSHPEGVVRGRWPSMADYLTAVADALERGTGPLMDPARRELPGLSLGCLLWEDPEQPFLDFAEWTPIH
ncbi:SMI1/KNR4 family protein [Streptomyces sp. NPDC051018]|uniref:SMI1/KNR4 family protein n=1 Tax=Streptomyces sp. NPDC051018 TaxID=3365639 RepID=UPI003796FE62